jgi:6-phosphogluconolactonase (cycloisomerase 2 family)
MKRLLGFTFLAVALAVIPFATAAGQGRSAPGAVYTMSNAAPGNEVLVYPRAANGALGPPVAYATAGLGTGGGLGNQGGLILTEDQRWLLVVNAGDDTVSVFSVESDGLVLTDVEPSGGQRPVSVTADRDLVYVLNAGGVNNIAGFRLDPHGQLTYLEGSSRPLSAASTGPAQIGIAPNGRVLVVTEKGTNTVDTYVLGRDGLAIAPMPNTFASPGDTPFGFDFGKRSQLFVSEAAGGAPGAGSASSYRLYADGTLVVISGAVPTTEAAACWLRVTNDGRHAFTTNTPEGSISSFAIAHGGTLSLRDPEAATPGGGPIDLVFSTDGRNLYTLNSAAHTISVFRVHADGRVTSSNPDVTVPVGANGLAAR